MQLLLLYISLFLISITQGTAEGTAHIYRPGVMAPVEVKLPEKDPSLLIIKNQKQRRIDNIKFKEGESADITINPNGAVSVIYQPIRAIPPQQ